MEEILMKISVIVPVYNAEDFLSETLESLVNQTLADDEYEIIIINDGSTDSSQDIIDAYQVKYSNIVAVQQKNQGVIAARNKAIALAKADYIACMDADDLCHRERLAIQYDYMQQHQLDLCGSFFEMIDVYGKLIKKSSIPVQHETCKQALIQDKKGIVILTSSTMFTKKIVLKAELFRDSFKDCEDYDLWLRMLHANGKIGNVPQYLCQYRQHVSNNTFLRSSHVATVATIARYAYQLREQGIKDGQDEAIDIAYLKSNLPDNLQQAFALDYFEARHHHSSADDIAMINDALKQFETLKPFAGRAFKARFYLKIAKGFFINKAYGKFMFYFTLALINDIKQSVIFIKDYLHAQRINRK